MDFSRGILNHFKNQPSPVWEMATYLLLLHRTPKLLLIIKFLEYQLWWLALAREADNSITWTVKCSELKSYKRQDVSHKVSTSTIPIYNIKATFLVSSLYVYLGSGICLYFSPSVFEIHGKVKGDTS